MEYNDVYMRHMITEAQEEMDDKQESRRNTRVKQQQTLLIPLSFVDDCNSIGIGSKRDLEKCSEQGAKEWALMWDKSTEWKDAIHLAVN